MQEHLIIIGGVAAGAKAAAKARRENPDLKITIYTAGTHISYSSCALPYYIENIIKDENKLLIRTPEVFRDKYNVDVHTMHKVTGINPEKKRVVIEDLETGNKFEDKYTKLLIATGASPIVPDLEGVGLKNIYTLRSFEDGQIIKNKSSEAKKVTIIGAGYIGIEMTESFKNSGHDVTLIEMSSQILPILDYDIAKQIEEYLKQEKGLKIIVDDGVTGFIGDQDNKVIQVKTASGLVIDTDLVLLSIGVKPNIDIAKQAGIEIGETGAIIVNNRMQTNIPDIYAAGDCVEDINIITGKPTWAPLGSNANKQGRVAAINITGGNAKFRGVLNSHVSKAFEYTITRTGLTEKEVRLLGYNYEVVTVTNRDKSGYFPGAENIVIKMLAEKDTRKLLGAQIYGKGDADKRINIIATALTCGMTVDDIPDIDITYAPPYSPAIDPVIIAAQQLQEKMGFKP